MVHLAHCNNNSDMELWRYQLILGCEAICDTDREGGEGEEEGDQGAFWGWIKLDYFRKL